MRYDGPWSDTGRGYGYRGRLLPTVYLLLILAAPFLAWYWATH